MNDQPIDVVALGASTPVGRDAWSSAAAVRAGISGFGQHPYMIDSAGEPMQAAIAPWLDIGLSGVERFAALLFPAIDQALLPLSGNGTHPLRLALSLGLPGPRPGLPADLQPALLRALGDKYRGAFVAVAAFPNGHAAGLLALEAAAKRLGQGTLDACVVAGVDSYIEPETLEWLEESDQLHGAGPRHNAWGFIPGEAAGAILLARRAIVERLQRLPLGRVLGLGMSFEPNRIKTRTVCIGEGLAQAVRGALQGLPDGLKVTDVYCDMNGEPYRADEYGFTCMRTGESFESGSDFVAPADVWGDVAAANGPLFVGLAAIANTKGYANGGYALAWSSSESGERVAALIGARSGG
jgi:3-oxoacyl-[acyl-carrier-protein] synthase-1